MRLKKITDIGKAGYIHVGQSEILTIQWNNGRNPAFFAFDKTLEIRQVEQEYFAKMTIGDNYEKIEQQLPSKIHNYQNTKGLNGDLYFCTFQEAIIYGFDRLGQKFLEWHIEVGEGHPIYDIKFQEPDYLWLAFPTGQTVTQVSLTDKKEVYKIGEYSWDDNHELLSFPESIFVKGDFLFIPNMGNNKLFKVNLETKKIQLLATFEERIWQYEETELGIFIITDTGIYKIED